MEMMEMDGDEDDLLSPRQLRISGLHHLDDGSLFVLFAV